jgi:hypothetical protein
MDFLPLLTAKQLKVVMSGDGYIRRIGLATENEAKAAL